MRSFANFIAFGNVFSTPPDAHVEIKSMYNRVFKPIVPIVEENCGTTLGSIESISLGTGVTAVECPTCDLAPTIPSGVTSILGKIDLRDTGEVSPAIPPDSPVTVDSINKYKNIGVYYIHVRTLSTCVSKGGVCRKCLWASGLVSSNIVDIPAVGTSIALNFTSDTTPFLSYLARSYSGSLVGMKSYSGARLPIREGIYEEVILKPTFITSFYRKVAESGVLSPMDLQYASEVQSSLEKVLFLLAQYQFSKPLSGV